MKEDDKKLYEAYERAVKKDNLEVLFEKNKFIAEIKSGLGKDIKSFNSYVKKKPSLIKRIGLFFSKLLKYI